MASDIWLRTILIVRKETHCRHIGYSYRLTARVLLYAPSHTQDNTYHGLCYTSRGVLAGTRNSSMGPPHEGSIRRPIAPWANALPLSYVPLLQRRKSKASLTWWDQGKLGNGRCIYFTYCGVGQVMLKRIIALFTVLIIVSHMLILNHQFLMKIAPNGTSDLSHLLKSLSYFLFQPVLHNWCNKRRGIVRVMWKKRWRK